MYHSRHRLSVSSLLLGLFGLVLMSTPVVAQQPAPDVSPTFQVGGTVLTSLVVCSGLLLLAPEYTTRTTARIHDKPVETGLYGIGLTIAVIFLGYILIAVLRGLGVLVLLPVLLGILVVSHLGYLSLGMKLTDNPMLVVLIAVAVSAFTAGIPILGGLVGLVLGCLGLGAAYLDYRDGGYSESGVGSDR